jgi:group I intron endonuclease
MKNTNNNSKNVSETIPKNSDTPLAKNSPIYPPTSVKVYEDAEKSKSDMLRDFQNQTIIYMFYNKVTGKVYVGSGSDGSRRLSNYYQPSILKTKGSLIYSNILKYGYSNFSVVVLEVCGVTGTVSKDCYLEREQFYIDWALKTYGLGVLNILKMADSSLGYKHTKENLILMSELRKGEKNPMYGKPKSEAFLAQQTKNKFGALNPQYGVIKSEETLAKLRKMVHVYNATDNYKLVGVYATVDCFRKFRMGYDTLTKRLVDGKIHKGYLFSKGPYKPSN